MLRKLVFALVLATGGAIAPAAAAPPVPGVATVADSQAEPIHYRGRYHYNDDDNYYSYRYYRPSNRYWRYRDYYYNDDYRWRRWHRHRYHDHDEYYGRRWNRWRNHY